MEESHFSMDRAKVTENHMQMCKDLRGGAGVGGKCAPAHGKVSHPALADCPQMWAVRTGSGCVDRRLKKFFPR